MHRIKMPRFIDNSQQMGLWEMDELLPFIALFGTGILMHRTMTFGALGLVLTLQMTKLKQSNLRGLLTHMGYWLGLVSLNKRDKNGLSREFIQ